jgi:hypothetical protein
VSTSSTSPTWDPNLLPVALPMQVNGKLNILTQKVAMLNGNSMGDVFPSNSKTENKQPSKIQGLPSITHDLSHEFSNSIRKIFFPSALKATRPEGFQPLINFALMVSFPMLRFDINLPTRQDQPLFPIKDLRKFAPPLGLLRKPRKKNVMGRFFMKINKVISFQRMTNVVSLDESKQCLIMDKGLGLSINKHVILHQS